MLELNDDIHSENNSSPLGYASRELDAVTTIIKNGALISLQHDLTVATAESSNDDDENDQYALGNVKSFNSKTTVTQNNISGHYLSTYEDGKDINISSRNSSSFRSNQEINRPFGVTESSDIVKSGPPVAFLCNKKQLTRSISVPKPLLSRKNKVNRRHSLTNSTLHTDVDTSTRKLNISDSHTSYRRILELEATELKLKLAESQTLSDTLQGELRKATLQTISLSSQVLHVDTKNAEMKQELQEMKSVTSQMQKNARLSSFERDTFRADADRYLKDNKQMKNNFTAKYKVLKYENKKYKSRMEELEERLNSKKKEVKDMETEMEWWKNQCREQSITERGPMVDGGENDKSKRRNERHNIVLSESNMIKNRSEKRCSLENGRGTEETSRCTLSSEIRLIHSKSDHCLDHRSGRRQSRRGSKTAAAERMWRRRTRSKSKMLNGISNIDSSDEADSDITNVGKKLSILGVVKKNLSRSMSYEVLDKSRQTKHKSLLYVEDHQTETQEKEEPSILSRWGWNGFGSSKSILKEPQKIEENIVVSTRARINQNHTAISWFTSITAKDCSSTLPVTNENSNLCEDESLSTMALQKGKNKILMPKRLIPTT